MKKNGSWSVNDHQQFCNSVSLDDSVEKNRTYRQAGEGLVVMEGKRVMCIVMKWCWNIND